jgi:hypothetical protein
MVRGAKTAVSAADASSTQPTSAAAAAMVTGYEAVYRAAIRRRLR